MTQLTFLPLLNDDLAAGDEDPVSVDSSDTPTAVAVPAPAEVAAEPVKPRRRGWQANAMAPVALDLPHKPDTLIEAIELIAASGHLDSSVLRHIRTDVRKALTLVQRSGHEALKVLPCDPHELRPLLLCVLPARHRMTLKRWSSVKASVTRVLKLTGWAATETETQSPSSPEWQVVTASISTLPQRSVVAAFARFCSREGLSPQDVTEATIESYRAWRLARTLDLTVRVTISQLRCILNRAGREVEHWPIRHLDAPKDPRRIALPTDQLPPAFVSDLNAYLERLRNPSPLDPVFNRRVAPGTLRDINGVLRRSASVLIRAGVQVASLRDVVNPDAMKTVLLEGYNRLSKDHEWPSRMQAVANWLRKAALQCGQLSADELARIDEMRKLVGSKAPRMSEKSRARVAQFDEDPRLLEAFLGLPWEAFRAADRLFGEGRTHRAARLHRTALSLAIVQAKPIRRENLAALEHERHFKRRGRLRYGEIQIPGPETKAGVPVRAELPPAVSERIEIHMTRYRPLLEAPDSPYLFSWDPTTPIDPRTLAHHVTRLVERQVGVRFNLHATRHLAATLLLDADPANLPVAQAVLGHADSKTTARFYGAQVTRGAQAHWMRTLEERAGRRRSKKRGGR
jgi:integrase